MTDEAELDRLRAVVDDLYEQLRQAEGAGPDAGDHSQRARAILEAKRLTLTRAERHELADWLIDFRGSWSTLPEVGARRLADAMSAFIGIQHLLAQRRVRR